MYIGQKSIRLSDREENLKHFIDLAEMSSVLQKRHLLVNPDH